MPSASDTVRKLHEPAPAVGFPSGLARVLPRPGQVGVRNAVQTMARTLQRSPRMSVSLRDACLARSLLAPPRAHRDPERVGREAARQSPRIPSAVPRRVLVTTDGSEASQRAFPLAAQVIRALNEPRVTLLRVLDPRSQGRATRVDALEWVLARAQAETDLQQIAGALETEDTHPVVAEGQAAQQILRFAETQDVDLVVIATHGAEDAWGWRMGSVARKVIASGCTSMLAVPAEREAIQVRTILVPLDCSSRAETVFPLATHLAKACDAELVLVHVVPEPELLRRLPAGVRDAQLIHELVERSREYAERYLQDVSERFRRQQIRCRVAVLSDTSPARAIEGYQQEVEADLTLLCAHGSGCRNGEAYGSVPTRLLSSLHAPTWIVQDHPPSPSSRVGRPTRH